MNIGLAQHLLKIAVDNNEALLTIGQLKCGGQLSRLGNNRMPRVILLKDNGVIEVSHGSAIEPSLA